MCDDRYNNSAGTVKLQNNERMDTNLKGRLLKYIQKCTSFDLH